MTFDLRPSAFGLRSSAFGSRRSLLALVLTVLGSGGCTVDALSYGRSLFDDKALSTAGSNAFACSTCHDRVASSTRVTSGYTLYDVVARPSWWGGNEIDLLDAVNQCVVNFMRGAPLTPMDDKGRALFVYLKSISPDASAPALPLTVVQDIKFVPTTNAAQGQALWVVGCANCHGDPHTGKGRISPQSSLVPDDSVNTAAMLNVDARAIVVEKVRHGKFFNIGGNMAPFSLEALSDDQLGAILGYLEGFGLPNG
jgi:thiosulfate dehydrogenase